MLVLYGIVLYNSKQVYNCLFYATKNFLNKVSLCFCRCPDENILLKLTSLTRSLEYPLQRCVNVYTWSGVQCFVIIIKREAFTVPSRSTYFMIIMDNKNYYTLPLRNIEHYFKNAIWHFTIISVKQIWNTDTNNEDGPWPVKGLLNKIVQSFSWWWRQALRVTINMSRTYQKHYDAGRLSRIWSSWHLAEVSAHCTQRAYWST